MKIGKNCIYDQKYFPMKFKKPFYIILPVETQNCNQKDAGGARYFYPKKAEYQKYGCSMLKIQILPMESNLFYDRCGIPKVVSPQRLKHFSTGRAIVKTTNLFKWVLYVGKNIFWHPATFCCFKQWALKVENKSGRNWFCDQKYFHSHCYWSHSSLSLLLISLITLIVIDLTDHSHCYEWAILYKLVFVSLFSNIERPFKQICGFYNG